MSTSPTRPPQELEQLLLNARLRDELEPFIDESLVLVDTSRMSTAKENEFLASLLAWERAPVVPIRDWFQPALDAPPPELLSDGELKPRLWRIIERLHSRGIVLEWTDHLSERQLYCLLLRDVLPAQEKQVELPDRTVAWRCLDELEDPDTWLRYYATPDERAEWAAEHGEDPPPSEPPPFPRRLPR